MVSMRAFFRGLILFLLLAAVAVWSVVATLQMTLLNPSAIKAWLQQSGAYENIVDTIEIRQVDATGVVKSSMLREAIKRAVPPEYIQKQTEKVVDAAFVWINGNAPAFTYSIPIQENRGEFVRHLGQLVQEKLGGLPPCSGSLGLSVECIPRAYTLESYAQSIAKQTAEDNDLFEQSVSSKDTPQIVQAISMLPTVAAVNRTLVWALPIFSVLAGAGFVLLSRTWRMGLTGLGKQLVVSMIFLTVAGGILWIFGGSADTAQRLLGGSDQALVSAVIAPIVQQAIGAMGMWLVFTAGGFVLLGAALWIIGYFLARNRGSE